MTKMIRIFELFDATVWYIIFIMHNGGTENNRFFFYLLICLTVGRSVFCHNLDIVWIHFYLVLFDCSPVRLFHRRQMLLLLLCLSLYSNRQYTRLQTIIVVIKNFICYLKRYVETLKKRSCTPFRVWHTPTGTGSWHWTEPKLAYNVCLICIRQHTKFEINLSIRSWIDSNIPPTQWLGGIRY